MTTKEARRPEPQVRLRSHRRGDRRDSRRQDDHRRRRRGPRERGRPHDRRREDHARGHQLHGEVRPRPHLHAHDRRPAAGARHPADGPAEHGALRHGLLRPDRGQGRHEHRHLGERSRDHRADGDRPRHPARRPRPPRSHVSAQGAQRRRARARRADRGGGRSGAHRRPLSGRRHLRNHERRRHDGAGARADDVREAAQAADDHGRGSDSVPHAHRGARAARGLGGPADRARRLPRLRVREHDRSRDARRAGQGGYRRRATTCSCASTHAA